MKPAPHFAAWPLRPPPQYLRWMVGGLVVLALVGCAGVLLRPWLEDWLPALGALALVAWLLALLLRLLAFRFNRHNAACYGAAVEQVEQRWWSHHRQQAALVDLVLIGPACSVPDDRAGLFEAERKPPQAKAEEGGQVLRSTQVLGKGQARRELQLARLLAMQLQAQRSEPFSAPLLHCYWQGSAEAWQVFAEETGRRFNVVLPDQPRPWTGLDSLDQAIDALHQADAEALVLCAGCESLPGRQDSKLPGGEAALLWLLGKSGGVRIARGEAFVADRDALPEVAERALRQCHLQGPTQACASFSPALAELGWNPLPAAPLLNFGELQQLEAPVALSLAAAHAQLNAMPSAWLASDPSCTLALGVVTPDDPTC
ncbi:hypothetical protein V0R50_11800 [Pseudomonas sp. 148P]|uniref:Transmembrane protein n=1 Tax=Pseudomonas ulcerans TaxID=3115852 RepID=A0ABU7HQU4_9PSED|nr:MULTISPECIES: hypothetical protein [unclassified Pseudomonas]MEE1922945.1 hypothetical protein [Pseudomonas sp. 147P]MEE1933907.1 hypothetical protein [Pseudomonas sp. 148P]